VSDVGWTAYGERGIGEAAIRRDFGELDLGF
jgi:hypothetical protein